MLITEEMAAPGTPARLLKYIRDTGVTIPGFCAQHRLDRHKLQNVIKGGVKRIDVDFALAVQRATDGTIAVEDWESA